MEYYVVLTWIQTHILAVVAVSVTIVLAYHYIIEKDRGIKLSKRYRDSIYEAQSKVFLNASQYLISGQRDLAIREFLSAVDINRETLETYFALGGLFRTNGEIDKAISIHRSLIARENISETDRLKALKELAIDFDKGGFIDKAIDTYKDVLKVNRDQYDVIKSLCRIFEDVEDWDQAYQYRIMLSNVGHEGQSETISHILVQKAQKAFNRGDIKVSSDDLEDAFHFAPSVAAKILRLKIHLIKGDVEQGRFLIMDLLKEHPMYASFIFASLEEKFEASEEIQESYHRRFTLLKDYFLELDDPDLRSIPSVVLSKVRLFKSAGHIHNAYKTMQNWMKEKNADVEVMTVEYIKLLIELDKKDIVFEEVQKLLDHLYQGLTKHYCKNCGHNSDSIFWRCPQCHSWETIQFRWKV